MPNLLLILLGAGAVFFLTSSAIDFKNKFGYTVRSVRLISKGFLGELINSQLEIKFDITNNNNVDLNIQRCDLRVEQNNIVLAVTDCGTNIKVKGRETTTITILANIQALSAIQNIINIIKARGATALRPIMLIGTVTVQGVPLPLSVDLTEQFLAQFQKQSEY